MKNAWKIGLLILSFVLLFSLAACGANESGNANANQSEAAEMTDSSEATESEAASEAFEFAGEYSLEYTTPDGDVGPFESFVVENDGTFSGAMASPQTRFEGEVAEDGSFEGEIPGMNGVLQGTIDADGNLEGTADFHSRHYTFEGEYDESL